MEKITYRLLFNDEKDGKRYYEFNRPIGCDRKRGGLITTQRVVVSDAKTHTERLVFEFNFQKNRGEKDFGILDAYEIVFIDFHALEGRPTSPLGTQNEITVEPDEVYLNRIVERAGVYS